MDGGCASPCDCRKVVIESLQGRARDRISRGNHLAVCGTVSFVQQLLQLQERQPFGFRVDHAMAIGTNDCRILHACSRPRGERVKRDQMVYFNKSAAVLSVVAIEIEATSLTRKATRLAQCAVALAETVHSGT
jgi:hypothetical protein